MINITSITILVVVFLAIIVLSEFIRRKYIDKEVTPLQEVYFVPIEEVEDDHTIVVEETKPTNVDTSDVVNFNEIHEVE